jgi:3-phosphoshikimate 1-carboxyvinyltransferase
MGTIIPREEINFSTRREGKFHYKVSYETLNTATRFPINKLQMKYNWWTPDNPMHALPIHPLNRPPKVTVRVPGSKSLTNRGLLVAALAAGKTQLVNALFSDDTHYFAHALQKLGFSLALDETQQQISVHGLGGSIPSQQADLYIGNAGTAARFLTAFLTLGQGEYTLDGSERMHQRPIGDLVGALNALGARVRPAEGDWAKHKRAQADICPPLHIQASGLPGGEAIVSGSISSQFLSALLMVAPYAIQPVTLQVADQLSSKPYVDMTIHLMRDFGAEVERQDYSRFYIPSGRYQPHPVYTIESDASAASYFFAVPAICGGWVEVAGLSLRSRQGDIAFLDVLSQMGCRVQEKGTGIAVHEPGVLRGVDVDLRDIPDTAQTLAAIAPFAATPTTIRGIASARVKESDRVAATCTELARLGVEVEEHQDGMTIQPCRDFKPATIQTYNDHRMAMAFALVGLRIPGITIQNPGCVSKTFPSYFQVLESLRSP